MRMLNNNRVYSLDYWGWDHKPYLAAGLSKIRREFSVSGFSSLTVQPAVSRSSASNTAAISIESKSVTRVNILQFWTGQIYFWFSVLKASFASCSRF